MADKPRRAPSAAELELWRTVMRDAQPLAQRRRAKLKSGDAPAPAAAPAPPAVGPVTAAPKPPPPSGPSPKERLAALLGAMPVREKASVTVNLAPSPVGAKSGIDKRTDEKVRRGRLPVDGRIDLHGMTQGEAHDALAGFVRRSAAQGRRLLLVITGKGGMPRGEGVLRLNVPRWLDEPGMRGLVLAVHQAQPQHGGSGAYYVFLKRRRE